MEGLTRLQDDRPTLALAEKIENQNDQVFLFHLKTVSWTDGKNLTADHFVHAWIETLSECARHPHHERIAVIAGAKELCAGKKGLLGLKTLSPHAFEVRLANPDPGFPAAVAHPVFWPRRKGSRGPALTLGKYFWNKSGSKWERNPGYYGEPAYFETIRFLTRGSLEQRWLQYQQRLADVLELPQDIPSLSAPASEIQVQPTGILAYLYKGPGPNVIGGQELVESVDTAEFSALGLPWITLQSRRPSTPETARRQWVRTTLYTESADLESLALNLKAQWAAAWKLTVDIQPWKGERTGFVLRQTLRDPFKPDAPPDWTLAARPARLLRNQRLAPLRPSPLGTWDISGSRPN